MPLFEKGKKSGHIKSLSEEEIQKKLYGTFQEGNARLLPEEQYRERSVFAADDDAQLPVEDATVFEATYDEEATDETDVPLTDEPRTTSTFFQEEEEPTTRSTSHTASDDRSSSVRTPNGSGKDEVRKVSSDSRSISGKESTDTQDLFSLSGITAEPTPPSEPTQSDIVEKLLENEESQNLGLDDEALFHIEHPENDSAIKEFATDYSLPSDTQAAEEVLSEVTKEEMTAPLADEPVPDSVAFTYDADTDNADSSSEEAPSKENQNLKNIVSSFRIDLAEFFDKVKRISPFLIGGIVFFLVFFFVVFNIWIRSSSKGVVVIDSEEVADIQTTNVPDDFVAVRPVTVRPVEREVVVTPAREEQEETLSRETPPVVAEPDVAQSFYTFQICVYGDTERASGLVDVLKAEGYDAFYEKFTTRSGRVLYNVYSGRFKDSQSANDAFKAFKRSKTFRKFPDSFIKWHK